MSWISQNIERECLWTRFDWTIQDVSASWWYICFLLMILVAPVVVLTERDVFCSWACWTRSGNNIPWTTTFENYLDIKAWQLPVSKNPWTCLKNHGLYQVPISFSFPGSQQSTRFPVITTAWWIGFWLFCWMWHRTSSVVYIYQVNNQVPQLPDEGLAL